MMIYKKIARARDEKALSETLTEIADRFGEPPPAVARLAAYARIRMRAEYLGVQSVTSQAGRVAPAFRGGRRASTRSASSSSCARRRARRSPRAGVLTLPAPPGGELPAALLAWLARLGRSRAAA